MRTEARRHISTDQHAAVLRAIVDAMQSEQGIYVPSLGRLAVVPVLGKSPRLIFHAARELNDLLAARGPA